MHLILDDQARIAAAGPTLQRLFPAEELIGAALFDLFEVSGPERIADMAMMKTRAGNRLRLTTRTDRGHDAGGRDSRDKVPRLRLRGHAVPLAGGGLLINLTFGVDVVPAVRLLQLDGSDFAPTDTAIELLYLAEANAAVMTEMRSLLERLERARLQAEDEARTDPLTGLRNRRALDSLLARLCREGAAFALLSIDLDGFKKVNDTLGHAAGDSVLVEIARRLIAGTTARDFVARIGGDEFVLVLPGTAGAGRLRTIGNDILAAISRPVDVQGRGCVISASVGIATVADGEVTEPAAIMARSDAGLYAAKRAGRGRVVLAALAPPGTAETRRSIGA